MKDITELFESFNPSIKNKKDKYGNYKEDNVHNLFVGFKHWYEDYQAKSPATPGIMDLTIGQKIDAILLWQRGDKVHPLTCGCSGKKFEIISKRLNGELFIECTLCGTTQSWIPDCVYEHYINSNKTNSVQITKEKTK